MHSHFPSHWRYVPQSLFFAPGETRPLPIHGDGSAKRSYLFVEDVAEAYDAILHKGELGETYNIGTQQEVTVLDVVRQICGEMGVDFDSTMANVADRPFNDQRYYLNSKKLEGLGWQQRTPWEEGLSRTIAWYRRDEIADGSYWASLETALAAHPTAPAGELSPRPSAPTLVLKRPRSEIELN